MKKIVLLLVVFLLLSCQQVLFSTNRDLKVVGTSGNHEIITQFEESDIFLNLFGDINPGQILISVSEAVTKYYSPDIKFKHLQVLLTHTSAKCSLIHNNNLIFGSSFYRIFSVPIYLQSENLLL